MHVEKLVDERTKRDVERVELERIQRRFVDGDVGGGSCGFV